MPHVTEEIWSQFHDTRLILGPWPEPVERDPAAAEAMERVQAAAATFRRSGALVALEGDEKRIFDAVVKPERRGASADGAVEAERERLGTMLANEASSPRRRKLSGPARSSALQARLARSA
jgi:valyl-tRNA synthetase